MPAPLLPCTRWSAILLTCALIATGAHAKPDHWTAEIDRLTQNDKTDPPARHGIVFVGSSSILKWESLPQDFPGLPVIRRGFGGSELADSVYFFERIVLPYQPRSVVLYAGDNDVKAGKTPEAIAADFVAFCAKLHATLPTAHLFYIAIKPSPSRWELHGEMQRANALIAAACARDPLLTFVDVYSAMLSPDGRPRPELFQADQLHLNAKGYAIWIRLLTPLLQP